MFKKDIKIFFVVSGLVSGGAERVLTIIANGLSDRGYNISIISKQHIKPFYKLNNEVTVIYPQSVIKYDSTLNKYISRLSVYTNLYKILKKEKPDVVIPFSTTTNGVSIILSKLLGLKVIASEHNNYKVGLKKPGIWFIKRVLYKFTDYLLVLTNRDAEEYYVKFIKNLIVMPNPLPLKRILSFQNSKREKVILAVGNIDRYNHKGFDSLLKIFSNINYLIPEYKLHIAGGGNQDFLMQKCIDLNIKEKVVFLGEVKNIEKDMQKAEVFTLTSRWEGLPMVLIESMSQGLACIAFDCFTGPRDIITHNVDGVLVKDQDLILFGEQLIVLLKDKKMKEKLGKAAIITSGNYNQELILDKWEHLLNKISV
jgi:glycosyltransferase involved in cell wall biosynthesis